MYGHATHKRTVRVTHNRNVMERHQPAARVSVGVCLAKGWRSGPFLSIPVTNSDAGIDGESPPENGDSGEVERAD